MRALTLAALVAAPFAGAVATLSAQPSAGFDARQPPAGAVHGDVAARRHGGGAEPAVAGRVYTLDGGPLPRLRARWEAPGVAPAAVDVAPDGTFELSPAPGAVADAGTVVIDVVDETARRYYPAAIRVEAHLTAGEIGVVLVPTEWTVSAGFYEGRVVPIDLSAAFEPAPGERLSLLPAWEDPIDWGPDETGTDGAGRPIPVAFAPAAGGRPIAEADSAAFWEIVGRLNRHVGAELFGPAPADRRPWWVDGGDGPGVLIEVDPAHPGRGRASTEMHRSVTATRAVVKVREPEDLRDTYLVAHELMHALHFGHTCALPSIMSDTCNHGPRPMLPSVYDVAYLELRFAVLDAQRRHRAGHGLLAALEGARATGLAPTTAQRIGIPAR